MTQSFFFRGFVALGCVNVIITTRQNNVTTPIFHKTRGFPHVQVPKKTVAMLCKRCRWKILLLGSVNAWLTNPKRTSVENRFGFWLFERNRIENIINKIKQQWPQVTSRNFRGFWGHCSKTSGWEDKIVLGHLMDDKIHILQRPNQ